LVSLWWVTFPIEKYKDFSSGLILMGGLPRYKKTWDFFFNISLIVMGDFSN
jgi:hypothetical protein